MGKAWDYDVPSVSIWKECLRVLRPGGHLLSFSGTRTYHMMAIRIENAGFEIRDMVSWIYGSGFPKSNNLSKSLDKMVGAKGTLNGVDKRKNSASGIVSLGRETTDVERELRSPAAKLLQGWGSALKPALEPIALCQKPLEDGLTIGENMIRWGCGGLNIDGSRIGSSGGTAKGTAKSNTHSVGKYLNAKAGDPINKGRWPANVAFDEFDERILILKDKSQYAIIDYYANYDEMPSLREKYLSSTKSRRSKEVLQSDVLGETFKTPVRSARSSASYEWNQERQSNRKPGATFEQSSQKRTLASNERSDSTPTLVRESDVPEMWRQYFAPTGLEIRSKACAAEILDEQTPLST